MQYFSVYTPVKKLKKESIVLSCATGKPTHKDRHNTNVLLFLSLFVCSLHSLVTCFNVFVAMMLSVS